MPKTKRPTVIDEDQNQSPAPWEYQIPNKALDGPKYQIGKAQMMHHLKYTDSPGPGSYMSNTNKFSNVAYSMKGRYVLDSNVVRQKNPGPGTYMSTQNLSLRPKNIVGAASFGKEQRLELKSLKELGIEEKSEEKKLQ